MKMRILIFDDETAILKVFESVCEMQNYEVFTFETPHGCPLDVQTKCTCPLNEKCADVIISDIRMPDLNGIDFIQQQLNKGCKVGNIALMSGQWTIEEREIVESLGCKIFLKPFTIVVLEEWLEECEKNIDPNRKLCNFFE